MEVIFSKILKKVLGKYVENFKSSQMDMKFWKGDIRLENLKLKSTALTMQNIPVKIRHGILKNVYIKFPWKKLKTEPTYIEISDFYALIDPDKDIFLQNELMSERNAFKGGTIEQKKDFERQKNLFQDIANNVADNLTIVIKNIHIRMELPISGFCHVVGFVLGSVTLYTTDDNNQKIAKINKRPQILRKKLTISDISVYFDPYQENLCIETFEESMTKLMDPSTHSNVIEPLSIEVFLSQDRRKEADLINVIEIVFKSLKIRLDLMQCQMIMHLLKVWNRFNRFRKYSHIPGRAFTNEYNKAWIYLDRCAYYKFKPLNFNLKLAINFLKNRERYCELFRNSQKKKNIFKKDSKKELAKFEKSLGEETLHFVRQYAEIVTSKEKDSLKLQSFDFSDINSFLEPTENLFSLDSFKTEIKIPYVSVVLLYAENELLMTLDKSSLNLSVLSTVNNYIITSVINISSIDGYVDKRKRNFFVTKSNLMESKIVMNKATNLIKIESCIKDFSIVYIPKFIEHVREFFRSKENLKEETVQRLHMEDYINSLRVYKLYQIELIFSKFRFEIPFNHEGNETVFALLVDEFKFGKQIEIIDTNVSDDVMFFVSVLVNHLETAKKTIVSNFSTYGSLRFKLHDDRNDIDSKLAINFHPFTIMLYHDTPSYLNKFIAYMFPSNQSIDNKKSYAVSHSKTSLNLDIVIEMFNVYLYDELMSLLASLSISSTMINANKAGQSYVINATVSSIKGYKHDNLLIDFPDEISFSSDGNKTHLRASNVFAHIEDEFIINVYNYILSIFEYEIDYENLSSSIDTSIVAEVNSLTVQLPSTECKVIGNINRIYVLNNANLMQIELHNMSLRSDDRIIFSKQNAEDISISIQIKTENNESTMVLELDSLYISLSTYDYISIMSTYDICNLLFESSPNSLTLYKYTIKLQSVQLDMFDNSGCISHISIGTMSVESLVGRGNSKMTISGESILGKYDDGNNFFACDSLLYNSNLDKSKSLEELQQKLISNIDAQLDYVIVNNRSYMWLSNLSYDSKVVPKQVEYITCKIGAVSVSLANNERVVFHFELKDPVIKIVVSKDCDVDVIVPCFVVSDFIKLNQQVTIKKRHQYFEISSAEVELCQSIGVIKEVLSEIDNITSPVNRADESSMLTDNIRLKFEKVVFMITSLRSKSHIYATMNDFAVNINKNGRVGYIYAESFKANAIAEKIICVKDVQLFLSINKDSFNDITKECIDNMEYVQCDDIKIESIYTNIRVSEPFLFYSNSIAKVLLEIILPDSKPSSQTKEISTSINFYHKLILPEFVIQINYIKHTFKTEFRNIELLFVNQCSFNIGNVTLKNESNIKMFSCSCKMESLNLDSDKKEANITISDCEVYMDFKSWLPLLSCLFYSPIFRLTDVKAENEGEEVVQTSFSFLIQLNNSKVLFPIKDFTLQLYSVFDFKIILRKNFFECSLRKFRSYFADKHAYPDILSDMSLTYISNLLDNGLLSRAISVSNVNAKLTTIDVIMLRDLYESFTNALNSLPLQNFHNKDHDLKHLNEFCFTSDSININLCYDNKHNRYAPCFSIKIPPTNFHVNSDDAQGDIKEFVVSPNILFYNEETGNYDNILEPTDFTICSTLLQNESKLHVTSRSHINVNVTVPAVLSIFQFYNDFKNRICYNTIYTEYPNVWITNSYTSSIHIIVGQNKIEVLYDQTYPLYGYTPKDEISFVIKDSTYSFIPENIIFYTNIDYKILLHKEAFNGGQNIVIGYNSNFINKTSREISVYRCKADTSTLLATIRPDRVYPAALVENGNTYFLSIGEVERIYMNSTFRISRRDNAPSLVPISYSGLQLFVLKIPSYNDENGTLDFNILAPVLFVSYLHIPIHVMYQNITEEVKPNSTVEAFIDNKLSKIALKVSIDQKEYVNFDIVVNKGNILLLKQGVEHTRYDVCLKTERNEQGQLVLTFYAPIVIFNKSNFDVFVELAVEKSSKKGDARCLDHILSLRLSESIFTPPNWNNEDHDNMIIRIGENVINYSSASSGVFYLPVKGYNKSFTILRYDITQSSFTRVLTISDYLIVKNELDFVIFLLPVEDIPNVPIFEGEFGLVDYLIPAEQSVIIDTNSTASINMMSKAGTFMFITENASSTPGIRLNLQQKTVFRVLYDGFYRIIELNVEDNGLSYIATFKKGIFPTPFIVTNDTESEIFYYQMINSEKFVCPPGCSSPFCFDEPCAYSSMFVIVNGKKFNISFLEATDFVQIDDDPPLYVAIKNKTVDTKVILISRTNASVENLYNINFKFSTPRLNVSLVDGLMRELFIASFSNLTLSLNKNELGTLLKVIIENLNVDDQNWTAQSPFFIYGRCILEEPFFEAKALMPPRVPLFTIFNYLHISLQRVDLRLDDTVISDIYFILNQLNRYRNFSVEPLQPYTKSNSKVSYQWAEISPVNVVIQFESNTKRVPFIKKLPYIGLIPNISCSIVLPGIVLARLTEKRNVLFDNMYEDYKSELFDQFVKVLLSKFTGKVISKFGAIEYAAQLLHIKKRNDLASISDFTKRFSEVFDNKKAVNGVFSTESMQMLVSELIKYGEIPSLSVLTLKSSQPLDMTVKPIGTGVFGIIRQDEPYEGKDMPVMHNALRVRAPRSFPLNRIQVYDSDVDRVSKVIIHHGMIKMFITFSDENCLALTNTHICMLSLKENVPKLKLAVPLTKIKVERNESVLSLEYNNISVGFHCRTEQDSISVKTFIDSKAYVERIFGQR